MNEFKRGTPGFGILTGCLFVLTGALIMWIGVWKTLLLAVLFALGYFLGAVGDKESFVKRTVNRVVPEKRDPAPIDFRREVEKEQQTRQAQMQSKRETEQSGEEEE